MDIAADFSLMYHSATFTLTSHAASFVLDAVNDCCAADELVAGSTGTLTVALHDPAGEPIAPDSLSYRIDCLSTGEAVRGDTPIGVPAASNAIAIEASDTALRDPANVEEMRKVTVTANFAGGEILLSAYLFKVSPP